MKQNSLNEFSVPPNSDNLVTTKLLAPCVKVRLNILYEIDCVMCQSTFEFQNFECLL